LNQGNENENLYLYYGNGSRSYPDSATLLLALLLNSYYRPNKRYVYVNVQTVYYMIFRKIISNSKDDIFIKKMNSAFEWLHEQSYIQIVSRSDISDKCGIYILEGKHLRVETKQRELGMVSITNWIMCTLSEIQSIFRDSQNVDPYNLVQFYLLLLTSVDHTLKYSNRSHAYMNSTWGFSTATIPVYIKELKRLNIIAVHNSGKYKDGHSAQLTNNYYSRIEDKDEMVKNCNRGSLGLYGAFATNVSKWKSGITRRYDACLDGAKTYINNPKEIRRLIKDCKKYNDLLAKDALKRGEEKDIPLLENKLNECK